MVNITRCAPRCRVGAKTQVQSLWTILKRCRGMFQRQWQRWCHPLSIQVWTIDNLDGETFWKAFNPKTGCSFSSDSEMEMRYWIEEQYRY